MQRRGLGDRDGACRLLPSTGRRDRSLLGPRLLRLTERSGPGLSRTPCGQDSSVATLSKLLGNLSGDRHRRGKQFEHLCKWFLGNDPVYASELRRVWLWDEWPGRWGADAGIDLVAETDTGKLWAVQAKAYDPRYAIKKSDVDTFLSESARPEFAYRLLIATTNEIGATARRTVDEQAVQVGLVMLADLEKAPVDWPVAPDDLRPRRIEPKTPLPHQREAVQAVSGGLERTARGQLVMACGTGKTLVELWVAETLHSERVLVLVPSLSLLAQTMREWAANASQPWPALVVCSDETVRGEDDLVERTSELALPVTTDPEQIAAFLGRAGRGVVFATYQSSPRLSQAFLDGTPPFDLAIADEAHRCVGPAAGTFATVVDANAIPGRRRLFMTATPRYFTGTVPKDGAAANDEIVSMDDPERFGPVLHRLSFGEAIERDLLSDYQVVIVGVDDATVRDQAERGALVSVDGSATDARTLAGQIGLAKAMHTYDLRRVVSFHSRVRSARAFSTSLPEVIAWMPADQRPAGTIWSRHVSGEMSSGHRDVLLSGFRHLDDGRRGVLANARCLAEGVDVPAIDGVAFIDPRRSEVDIVQAVGRAIRRSEDKTIATVVLPVFIDDSQDAETVLAGSAFKPVWAVLRALRAHDEVLAEQLDGLRRELGRRPAAALRLPSKVIFDLPISVGTEFAEALTVRLVEHSTSTWEFWFGLLTAFVDRKGHARVPVDHVELGHKLGIWVNSQRSRSVRGVLDEVRAGRLAALPGWVWSTQDADWEEGFRHLAAWVGAHGHARVPDGEEAGGYRLGQWGRVQRRQRRKGQLDSERACRLEALPGWVWDPFDADWEEGYRHLSRWVRDHGHARVPGGERVGTFQLGNWVAAQRRLRRREVLADERAQRLERLTGWVWSTQDADWDRALECLQRYIAREGHARVHPDHVEGDFALGRWVAKRRSADRNGGLDSERHGQLQAIPGWTWEPFQDDWEIGFAVLESFVKRMGAASPSDDHVEDGFSLGQWARVQRVTRKKDKLSDDHVRRLEGLPRWSWSVRTSRWEEGLARLAAFADTNGHTRVPQGYLDESGFRLGQWVSVQRQAYRQGKLGPDRAERLEALARWQWDPHGVDWEEGFERLVVFLNREGHGRVRQDRVEDDGFHLGRWVAVQRRTHDAGKLRPSRIDRLEAVPGWTWDARQA